MPDEEGWKAKAIDGLWRQGPSFVLLCALGYGLAISCQYIVTQGAPAFLSQVQKGYESIEKRHEATENALLQRIDLNTKGVEANTQAVRHLAEVIDRLTSREVPKENLDGSRPR